MAINTVSVVGPRAETPKQEKPKKDAMQQILEGLQIANGILGIGTNVTTIQNNRAKQGVLDDEASGVLPAQSQQDALKSGMQPVEKGAPGSQTFRYRTGGGDAGVTEQAFIAPPKAEKAPLAKAMQWKTDTVKDGKNVTQIHYNDDTDQFVPSQMKPVEDKTSSNAQDLRKEYTAHPVTKDTGALASGFKKIQGAASTKTPTGASDMSLVYGYMKMLDPGTGVKEGEYASAEDTRSLDQKVVAAYNKAVEGVKLNPEQRSAFLHEASTLMNSQLDLQDEQDRRFTDLAVQFKVPPKSVIDPTWAGIREGLKKLQTPTPRSNRGLGEANAAPAGAKTATAPGSVVEIGGQRFKVAPDGDTLIPLDGENSRAIPPQQVP